MKFREYLQESRIDIGTSGTKTYDLDYEDPITQLDLYFEGTNGATYNIASPFERCISKIELVDGGEVLWDLPGEVAFAAFCTDNEGVPYAEREETGNGSVRQQIPIRFGRYLWDEQFAFSPRAFRNPQLKFTFNEAAVNTAGATGYVSDSWTFTLGVRLMEDFGAPGKFLSYRTVESFTSAGTGARRIEMPVDRPIRYLICRAYEAGVALYTSITNHKLSENGGKFVPFDLATRDFMNRHCETFKPIVLGGLVALADATTSETWVGIPLQGHVTTTTNNMITAARFYIYSQLYGRQCDDTGASVSYRDAHCTVLGWGLHNTLMYAFGDRMKPEHWYVPPSGGKLDYFVTDGDADADVDVCVQQVFSY